MKYIKEIAEFKAEQKSAVTLGKFDGVHRGHRKLIRRVLEAAGERQLTPTVFTFDVPPQAALGAARFQTLMINQERRDFLEQLGIQTLVEGHFSELKDMEAEAFVKEILVDRLKAVHFVVGPDFHFGKNRKGSPEFLKQLGETLGFTVEILSKEMDGERVIGSSYIREELRQGRIEKANQLLGYTYFITGQVVHGRHQGSGFGFPTINLIPSPEKLLPPRGVYASRTKIAGKVYRGVSNLGVKPTVRGTFEGLETYLFRCDEDLYGREARVELLAFLRPEEKFPSVEALKQQLRKDVKAAERIF